MAGAHTLATALPLPCRFRQAGSDRDREDLHLLLDHDDPRFPEQNGLRIELQVRTHLQHAWATAVEALGLYLRVNIKGGEGSEAWRRLLMLMSCEFAESEGCAPVRGAPSGGERRSEIIELDRQIGAQGKLDTDRRTPDLTVD